MSPVWVLPLGLAAAGALVAARGARKLSAETARVQELTAAVARSRTGRPSPAAGPRRMVHPGSR